MSVEALSSVKGRMMTVVGDNNNYFKRTRISFCKEISLVGISLIETGESSGVGNELRWLGGMLGFMWKKKKQ